MIVIGADTHKRTHTCGAVDAATGRLAGELTAPARGPGFRELLAWGRGLDGGRIWAIEDCRHVSGSFERFLVASGERVVRVPPKLTGQSRRGERTAGKSDPIDALAIARAALREGPDTLPAAHLDEEALQVKLLLDHREDLVRSRAEDQCRLRWHLHDLWPDLELPAGCLDRIVWLDRGGNRQLNCALHRIAVTQGRCHAPAREFLARKQAEGKTRIEALRCLKRHLARRVWRLLLDAERGRLMDTVHAQRDLPAPQIAAVA
jgi:hypothetical protein